MPQYLATDPLGMEREKAASRGDRGFCAGYRHALQVESGWFRSAQSKQPGRGHDTLKETPLPISRS
jgi:hypothetical protein